MARRPFVAAKSLEFLGGRTLPGVAAPPDAEGGS